jgi:UDP-N-acetylmuramyl pentapeptide phosphotransferase/UDP-N-acetylglucosamine-1-phosphate transferase
MVQVALSLSFLMSVFIVILSRNHFVSRDDLHAVQASHVQKAARFGGVAVLVGLCGALALLPMAPGKLLFAIILCALPVFAAGLAEDAGWRVAPVWRLAASICSSLLAIGVLGTMINRMGAGPLDLLVAAPLPALLLTTLVLTGVSQAFNLIDGLHGLCGFAGLITAAALTAIAMKTGHDQTVHILWAVMAALGGFVLVNYPRGLVFLGDAGAYLVGFILAYLAIDMLGETPDLSPWAMVLVFFWPLADMTFAVARRMGKKKPSFRADRMHFHHVVLRGVEILLLRKKNRRLSNPLATLILLPLMAGPAILGVAVWNDNRLAFALVVLSSTAFVLAYNSLVSIAKGRGQTRTDRARHTKTVAPSRRRVRAWL